MTKNEFLSILGEGLANLPNEERREILYDYEEHFVIGLENGKTETELVTELGDPRTIAKQYKATQIIEKAQQNPSITNIFNAIFSGVSLGFFNLIFVLGPFIGLIALLIGLFGASAGITIGGLGMLLGSIIYPFFPEYIAIGNISPFALIFLGIGILALGMLFSILNCYIAKYIFKISVKYLQWNLNFMRIKGGIQNV